MAPSQLLQANCCERTAASKLLRANCCKHMHMRHLTAGPHMLFCDTSERVCCPSPCHQLGTQHIKTPVTIGFCCAVLAGVLCGLALHLRTNCPRMLQVWAAAAPQCTAHSSGRHKGHAYIGQHTASMMQAYCVAAASILQTCCKHTAGTQHNKTAAKLTARGFHRSSGAP
jgi:hypothetical protein